jgi:hypothetical protein
MAPISAESKVRWGFVSLETTRDMAGLRFSEQHFRQSPALTGESPHHRRRWVKPSRLITSPTDFYPIEQLQMMRFTGEKWQLFGQSSALSSDFSDEPAMHRARLFRSDRRRRRRPGVAFLAVLHARLELVAGAGEPRA